MNAKQELIAHISGCEVKYVHITIGQEYTDSRKVICGKLEEVLPLLDLDYDNGFGSQYLFGIVWYTDGSWSDRREYDGAEWWEYHKCPSIPDIVEK